MQHASAKYHADDFRCSAGASPSGARLGPSLCARRGTPRRCSPSCGSCPSASPCQCSGFRYAIALTKERDVLCASPVTRNCCLMQIKNHLGHVGELMSTSCTRGHRLGFLPDSRRRWLNEDRSTLLLPRLHQQLPLARSRGLLPGRDPAGAVHHHDYQLCHHSLGDAKKETHQTKLGGGKE